MNYGKHALFFISLILIVTVGAIAYKIVNRDEKMRKEKRKRQRQKHKMMMLKL